MALAVLALGLFSCADEPDKYKVASGLPSVSYVRCMSTEIEGSNDDPDMHYTVGELVTEASPQSIICLVGKNLRTRRVFSTRATSPTTPSSCKSPARYPKQLPTRFT